MEKPMLDTVWKYQAHQRIQVATFQNSYCFAAVRRTRIVCLDIVSGLEMWSAKVENPWGWIAVTKSHVFYLNQHEKLIALSINDGSEIWSRHLSEYQEGDMPVYFGWLHAFGDSIIVGGWRGYQDILCLNAADGTLRWSFPAKGKKIFGTYLYPEMGAVLIASREDFAQWRSLPDGSKKLYGATYLDPETGSIISNTTLDPKTGTVKGLSGDQGVLMFIDLRSGDEVFRFILPGSWSTWSCDFIAKPIDDNNNSTIIFKDDNNSFYRISGIPPTAERLNVDQGIWSINLLQVGEFVPFLSDDGSLIAFSVSSRKSIELAKIAHNRRDMLPFFSLKNGACLVGTSFGMVYLINNDSKLLAKRKIGKRVSTQFSVCKGVLCFGTASGEILGLNVP
jgi:hypothetical protein